MPEYTCQPVAPAGYRLLADAHMSPPSPDKARDPLGWPFGALPPKDLRRLLREQAKHAPSRPAQEPAPF